jgi:hypothetical protein
MASSDPSDGGDEREVFGSLPKTRPQRRSAKRDRPSGAAKAAAAESKAKAAPKAKPKAAKPRAKTTAQPRAKASAAPRAKASGAPPKASVPPAGYATPRPDEGVPHGAQLVTTAVQAAGELAQIGISAGGRALKSALQRLPKP